jgi:hypothetical protein
MFCKTTGEKVVASRRLKVRRETKMRKKRGYAKVSAVRWTMQLDPVHARDIPTSTSSGRQSSQMCTRA